MMMRASRLFPSIRRESTARWKSGGSGDSSSNKNAMLEALLPDSPAMEKSKRGVMAKNAVDTGKGTRTPKGTLVMNKNPTTSPPEQQTIKPAMSFFDEVDIFLAKETDTTPRSMNNKTARNATGTMDKATPSSSPKWTSYLPNAGREGSPISPKKSIFDVFKVPAPAPQRSEFAFDSDGYDAYIAIIETSYLDSGDDKEVDGKKLPAAMKADVEQWLRRDEPKVSVNLPFFTLLCEQGIERLEQKKKSRVSLKKQARDELKHQAKVFQDELGWNKDQYTFATAMIHEIAKLSCKSHKALPVMIILEKMKEAGYVKQKTIARCLKASASFSGGSLSRGWSSLVSPLSTNSRLYDILEGKEPRKDDPAATNDKEDVANVSEQLAELNDLFYETTHHSTSIRTRRLVSLGDADGALELIDSNMEGEAKLRAYPQVFSLYLELGQINAAMRLFQKMKRKHAVVPVEPEMFVQLIASTAERGFFCQGSKEVGAAAPTSGPALFDHMAQDMAQYVYSISSASAKRLQKAFKRGFEGHGSPPADVDTSALAPLKPLGSETVPEHVLIADRVSVEASTGFCTCSNVSLTLMGLETHQKTEMKNSLVNLVRTAKSQRGKKSRQVEAMLSFWDWMRDRTGRPYTVIVDGANAAYYMQNFDRGKFNFHQIQFAVTALEGIGEHPLVILPQKYQKDIFDVILGTTRKRQQASPSDKAILNELNASGKLYLVPPGCLDDYFWLLASVCDQPNCQALEVKASQSDDKTKWPGTRPVVMTNDQIRDHQEFQFLESRLFNRWYSSTIMNYNFTGFVSDECVDPEIAFTPADVYSREIQRNATRTNGTIDGATWHFPVQDWDTTDWFCIRLPLASESKV